MDALEVERQAVAEQRDARAVDRTRISGTIFGTILVHFGTTLGYFGTILGPLGPFGAIWGHLEPVLGPFGAHDGRT